MYYVQVASQQHIAILFKKPSGWLKNSFSLSLLLTQLIIHSERCIPAAAMDSCQCSSMPRFERRWAARNAKTWITNAASRRCFLGNQEKGSFQGRKRKDRAAAKRACGRLYGVGCEELSTSGMKTLLAGSTAPRLRGARPIRPQGGTVQAAMELHRSMPAKTAAPLALSRVAKRR